MYVSMYVCVSIGKSFACFKKRRDHLLGQSDNPLKAIFQLHLYIYIGEERLGEYSVVDINGFMDKLIYIIDHYTNTCINPTVLPSIFDRERQTYIVIYCWQRKRRVGTEEDFII